MGLPIAPPFKPQLARGKDALPGGEGWAYEPKWDGFRAIVFVDAPDADRPVGVRESVSLLGEAYEKGSSEGPAVTLLSRGGKGLERYFPEIVVAPGRYVLDGELIIDAASGAAGGAEDFDLMSNRIHPAQSRIDRLSVETPARFVAFDLLALDDLVLLELPFERRRAALEQLFGVELLPGTLGAPTTTDPHQAKIAGEWAEGTSMSVTPLVRSASAAQPWLAGPGEGVVAKELAAQYVPGARKGMVKVKRLRTIDAVVAGWRPGKEEGTVGSLMLGLYDDAGELQVVGHTSGFKAKEKRELIDVLAPYETGERGTADPSRWRADEELEWVALRPELVVEVSFDQVTNGRIRHGTKLQRWRQDKAPGDCTVDQLDQ